MDFKKKLVRAVKDHDSLLCVGLDPDLQKLPEVITKKTQHFYAFNTAIIKATQDVVCAYKLNSAMYEAQGHKGIQELQKTCRYILEHTDVPVILDFKRADIGNTNNYYAEFAFDYLGVDAITINPYMGKEANEAFLAYQSKGIVVLCKTSNPGAGEFQDMVVDGKKLYERVAEHVMKYWNEQGNCLLVVGATYPTELAALRSQTGEETIFLIPGAGTQGGSVAQTVKAGMNKNKAGIIINSSREIIFASNKADYAEAARSKARALRDEINKYR